MVVQEADVFAVDVNVEKAAQLAVLITETIAEAREGAIEGLNQLVDAAGFKADGRLIGGELLQRSRDQNLNGRGNSK